MKLFVLTLVEEDAYDWFHDSDDCEFKTIQDLMHAFLERWGDDQVETYNELVDAFMEKWKEKELPDIKTDSSDIKMDAPIEKVVEDVETAEFIDVNQLRIWKLHLASTSNYIEFSTPIELKLHSEQEMEFHLEILEEPINESVIDQGEIEFEVVEYPNNSNPHPPPKNPSLQKRSSTTLMEIMKQCP
jgi:hypothetical protein